MRTITVLILALFSLITNAQDFSVSPVELNFSTQPGTEQQKTLSILNNSNKKQTFQLRNRDFIILNSGQRKILSEGASNHSIANWLTYSPSYLELNPNESQEIEITLSAPSSDYKARWGIINVFPARERTSLSADKNLETGVMVTGRISVLVLYNPSTNSEYDLKVTNLQEITSDKPGMRKFEAEVNNLGNRIARCKSYLLASSMETMEDTRFRPIDFMSYPGTSIKVNYYLPDQLQPGKYSLAAILNYGDKSKLEGTQTTITVK